MAYRTGRCTNDLYCSFASAKQNLQVPLESQFVCPQCGKPLSVPPPVKRAFTPGATLIISVLVVIGAGSFAAGALLNRPAAPPAFATAAAHAAIPAVVPPRPAAAPASVPSPPASAAVVTAPPPALPPPVTAPPKAAPHVTAPAVTVWAAPVAPTPAPVPPRPVPPPAVTPRAQTAPPVQLAMAQTPATAQLQAQLQAQARLQADAARQAARQAEQDKRAAAAQAAAQKQKLLQLQAQDQKRRALLAKAQADAQARAAAQAAAARQAGQQAAPARLAAQQDAPKPAPPPPAPKHTGETRGFSSVPIEGGTPAYPDAYESDGRTGRVTVSCTISTSGSPGGCRVVASEGGVGFNNAVLGWLRSGRVRFAPILRDGKPQTETHSWSVNFQP
jgi:TonB family protein